MFRSPGCHFVVSLPALPRYYTSLSDLAGLFDVVGYGQDFFGVVASALFCSTRPVFCIRLLIYREAATIEPPCYV